MEIIDVSEEFQTYIKFNRIQSSFRECFIDI
jgi:hypothetical protein